MEPAIIFGLFTIATFFACFADELKRDKEDDK